VTKISQLSSIGDSLAIGDQFLIRDIDDTGSPNKSVTISGMTRALDTGTALAPALAFASDKNTGIYSPGADQVAISTNGAQRAVIDGLGQLTLAAKGNGLTNGVIFNIPYTATANGVSQVLQVQDTGAVNAIARINMSAVDLGTSNGAFITFATSPGGAGPATGDLTQERMRLDSSGRLGLGTSSPQATLHATGAILSSGALVALSASNIFFDQSTSALSRIGVVGANTSTAGTLGISQYSSDGSVGRDVVHINSSGLVGIGTTSPGSALEINAAAATSPFIAKINTAEAARIDSSGRLLIGTSSDSGGALLQVNDNRIRIATANTPASAGATGTTGEIAWDADYIYVCTATNTWKRTAISTW
jgi:hypothetical protein